MRPSRWLWALGLLAGLVSGLLGVGGGLVVSPLLLLSGLSLAQATGTALAVIPLVAAVAVIADILTLPGNLQVGLALAVAVGGPLGVFCGRQLYSRLPARRLKFIFQFLLLLTALRSFGLWGSLPTEALAGWSDNPYFRMLLAAGLGSLGGVCAVLFGVGGGVVVVPGLIFVVGAVDYRAATAASLLAMVPTAWLSLRVALASKRVVVSFLPPLLGGAIPAAAIAVWLRNQHMQPDKLSLLFACFLLFVMIRLGFNREDSASNSDPHWQHKS